jgi:ATP-dependent RNA helicase RhlE
MRFEDLQLIPPLIRAVEAEGYSEPTPIQVQAIPHVLAGRDVLGCAQTGTGKTAAFALPILQRLRALPPPPPGRRPIRVLVLSPTRELAAQINDSFEAYGRHTGLVSTVIFGGVGQEKQTQALARGVDILVATPGRLLDLMGQGYVRYGELHVLVLDEADRMLDMGFIHDVKRVVAALPRQRQTLLFSATLPRDIVDLAREMLIDPVRVEVTPAATTVESIEQWVYFVEKGDKRALLDHLLSDPAVTRALIFTRTKHGANKVVQQLERRGAAHAEAIHGNKSQGARERALSNFKAGTTRALIATDIAARGLDVEAVSHVINYDLPNEPEVYVHRIGRTGRAGAGGVALSFCDRDEREFLYDIERLIRLPVPVVLEHPYRSPLPLPVPGERPRSTGPRPAAGGGRGAPGRGRPGGGRHEHRDLRDPRAVHGGGRGEGRPPAPATGRPSASPAGGHGAPGGSPAGGGESYAVRTINAGLRSAERRRGGGRGGPRR